MYTQEEPFDRSFNKFVVEDLSHAHIRLSPSKHPYFHTIYLLVRCSVEKLHCLVRLTRLKFQPTAYGVRRVFNVTPAGVTVIRFVEVTSDFASYH